MSLSLANSQTDSNAIAETDYLTACKAAGDELRMQILHLLGQGSFSVLEICDILAVKQSSLSHHLKRLIEANLLVKKREGNSIFYARPLLLQQNAFNAWLGLLFAGIDDTQQFTRLQQAGLQQVWQERKQACAQFFARHADEFKAQQDLIASYDQYGTTLQGILTAYQGEAGAALELGVGEGSFLPALAARFKQVYAIDIAKEMLDLAAQKVHQLQLTNVQLALAGSESWHTQMDFISINMVLHHVPSPKTVLVDAAALLKPQGTLLITDLYRHEQHWAKDSCGDLWLGFEPEELSLWATQAGLREKQSQYLGLNNGFQIQFRLFNPLKGEKP